MEATKSLRASSIVFWWILAVVVGWLAEELLYQTLPDVDRTVSLALGLSIVATGQSYVLRRWIPAGGVWVFATTIGGMIGFLVGLQIAASDSLRTNEYLSTIIWWGSIGAGAGIAQALQLGRVKLSRPIWIVVNTIAFALGGGLTQLSHVFLPNGYWQPVIFGLSSGGVAALALVCLLSRAGYDV